MCMCMCICSTYLVYKQLANKSVCSEQIAPDPLYWPSRMQFRSAACPHPLDSPLQQPLLQAVWGDSKL